MTNPTSLGRILLVDDDVDLVTGLALTLRRNRIDTLAVHSAVEAMQVLKTAQDEARTSITVKPIVVVLSDLRMPGLDGISLLSHVKENYPDITRMLLTGESDVNSAAAAVNAGGVFRFLQKPCQSPMLLAAVADAYRQYELITSERVLLSNTLRGAVKAMGDLLSLTAPALFGRANRLSTRAKDLASQTGLSDTWRLELAALFSPLALASLPAGVAERLTTNPTATDELALDRALATASEVLGHIPRLEDVVETIVHQRAAYDGSTPGHPRGENLPMEARILRIVTDYDALESVDTPSQEAIDIMRSRMGVYDPILLARLAEILGTRKLTEPKRILVSDLRIGMRLANDLHSATGTLLMARGFTITPAAHTRIDAWPEAVRDQMIQIEVA